MNTKLVAALLFAVLVIPILYFAFLPTKSGHTPEAKEFQLHIVDKKLAAGPSTLTVKQGDTVTIKILSDEAEEFHLHGYDRSIDLVPDVEGTLTFVAQASGHFEFELEKSKIELGALDVLP